MKDTETSKLALMVRFQSVTRLDHLMLYLRRWLLYYFWPTIMFKVHSESRSSLILLPRPILSCLLGPWLTILENLLSMILPPGSSANVTSPFTNLRKKNLTFASTETVPPPSYNPGLLQAALRLMQSRVAVLRCHETSCKLQSVAKRTLVVASLSIGIVSTTQTVLKNPTNRHLAPPFQLQLLFLGLKTCSIAMLLN